MYVHINIHLFTLKLSVKIKYDGFFRHSDKYFV